MSTMTDDLTMTILGDDDVTKMFKDLVKTYFDKGLQEAMDQVNVEIKEKGIE